MIVSWINYSVQFSFPVMSDSLWPHGLQHTRLPRPSPTPRACSNSCPLSRWCPPTISSSIVPFSSRLQSFPASGSFQWVSSSHQVAKVLELQLQHSPSNEYSGRISLKIDWFDLLVVQGIARVFSNTTVQKHQFLGTQLSLCPALTSIHDYGKNRSFD